MGPEAGRPLAPLPADHHQQAAPKKLRWRQLRWRQLRAARAARFASLQARRASLQGGFRRRRPPLRRQADVGPVAICESTDVAQEAVAGLSRAGGLSRKAVVDKAALQEAVVQEKLASPEPDSFAHVVQVFFGEQDREELPDVERATEVSSAARRRSFLSCYRRRGAAGGA